MNLFAKEIIKQNKRAKKTLAKPKKVKRNINIINKRVRKLRIKHKLTQKEFAFKLGFTQSFVSKIESGNLVMNLGILVAIRKVFKVSIDEMVGLE